MFKIEIISIGKKIDRLNEWINEKGIGYLIINNLVINIRYFLFLLIFVGFFYICIIGIDIVNDMFNFYFNFEINVEGFD